MASLDEATNTKASAKAKVPLLERFKAWWEGYEPVSEQAEPAPLDAASQPAADDSKLRYEASEERWTPSRIELVQQVWGEGLVGPGSPERILELVKPLGLNPAMSLLDLGAGLGGAARAVADHFGVWVTALEADSAVAEAGMALSEKAGFVKKAPVEAFDPESFEAEANSYDRLFSKEFLFTIQDKGRILRTIEQALKEKGQALITDFVLAEPGRSSPALDSWVAAEPGDPAPWSKEDYLKHCEELKLEVRVSEDITEETGRLITQAWAAHMTTVDHAGLDNAAVSALVDEAELWARRVKLLEGGDLAVYRFHAFKE